LRLAWARSLIVACCVTTFKSSLALATSTDGAWRELPAPPRYGHTAVVDTRHNRIVLLSGFGWTRVDQLWQHSLDPNAEWTPLEASGESPPPRVNATAIYDSRRGRAILFGGFDGNSVFDDVWEFQLNGRARWRRLDMTGEKPSGRFLHSAIYDAHSDRMIVFGGTDRAKSLNDVWALDLGGRLRWQRLVPAGIAPAARIGAYALYDARRSRMLIVGGDTSPVFDWSETLWALDLNGVPKWERLTAGGYDPGPLGVGPGVLDASRDRALFAHGNGYVVSLSLSDLTWLPNDLRLGPPSRADHIALLDSAGDRMWVYGGRYGTLPRSDTWTYPLAGSGTWAKVPPEGEIDRRSGHTAIFDSRRERMVVYGGHLDWDGPGTGTWPARPVWIQDFRHGDAWAPLDAVGPVPAQRNAHVAVYDSLSDRMIVYGGYGGGYHDDTWALSFGSNPAWTQVITQGNPPSQLDAASAIFDPGANRMIVYGGGRLSTDTYELALGGVPTWRKLEFSGVIPPGRREHSAVYDPLNRRMLVFGGITTANNYDNDVWSMTLDGPPKWTQIVVQDPVPRGRQSPAVIFDPEGNRLIVHGGYDGTYLIRDAWELPLDGEPRWRQLEPDGNVPIFWFDHAAVLDAPRHRMVIFGEFGSWALGWDESGREIQPQARATRASVEGVASIEIAASNPLRGEWSLRARLPASVPARIKVRTASGRIVLTKSVLEPPLGASTIRIEGSGALPAGVYFVQLEQGDRMTATKVVHLR
jgi:Kelch motif/Galactose oxidase, central domain